mmetsp:Transcript_8498/g.27170  ORF Transcript_8498/g.27170 Transcript_8498/m.27170 type:complete len:238 (+) Transcript_8498:242-955(+)
MCRRSALPAPRLLSPETLWIGVGRGSHPRLLLERRVGRLEGGVGREGRLELRLGDGRAHRHGLGGLEGLAQLGLSGGGALPLRLELGRQQSQHRVLEAVGMAESAVVRDGDRRRRRRPRCPTRGGEGVDAGGQVRVGVARRRPGGRGERLLDRVTRLRVDIIGPEHRRHSLVLHTDVLWRRHGGRAGGLVARRPRDDVAGGCDVRVRRILLLGEAGRERHRALARARSKAKGVPAKC